MGLPANYREIIMETQTILADHDRQFSWHNYNESQTKEKTLFVNILNDLCNLIIEPKNEKGRKPTPIRDIVFSIVLKEYLRTSSRRLQGDLKLFAEGGFLSREIPFTTLLDNLEKDSLKEVMKECVEISSLPLREIELDFAIDSTGFSISRYVTYFDFKYNKDRRQKLWRKCHAVCGVKTNIITAVDIAKGYSPDVKYFEPLAKDTARNFQIREFSGDKAYLSKANMELIYDMGGSALIPFKSNSSKRSTSKGSNFVWGKMYRYFKQHNEEYMQRYHKRSNIESTFSMLKRKFGNNVKCKKIISQDNEILAKVLAHNICVLVQEMFLNKINVNFQKELGKYSARE
jgi:transposase